MSCWDTHQVWLSLAGAWISREGDGSHHGITVKKLSLINKIHKTKFNRLLRLKEENSEE